MSLDSESAKFVVAHLLSKPGELSINDIKVIQQGLLDEGMADFPYPNGSFGPGTSQGVINFLSQDENLHIASRLGQAARDALAAAGFEDQLAAIEERAIAAGHDPASVEGDTIESLVSQPYPLSHEEAVHLQTMLHEAGHYKLGDNEFTKFADGSPMRVHPNGIIGAQTILGVADYIAENNSETVLQNPQILEHMWGQSGHWGETQRRIAETSVGYETLTDSLTDAAMEEGASQLTIYRAQYMLRAGAFYGGEPDGGVGQWMRDAVEEYRSETHGSLLNQDWKTGGQEPTQHASADLDVKTPASVLDVDEPIIT